MIPNVPHHEFEFFKYPNITTWGLNYRGKLVGNYTLMASPFKMDGHEAFYLVQHFPTNSLVFLNSDVFCQEVLINTHFIYANGK